MIESIYIGRIFGTFLFFSSLAFLLDSTHYRKVVKEVLSKPAFVAITGFLAFLVGLIMVIFHNVWNQGWETVITIVSWLVLLSGAFRLFFPKTVVDMGKHLQDTSLLWCYWIGLVIGAYMMYMTFFYMAQYQNF